LAPILFITANSDPDPARGPPFNPLFGLFQSLRKCWPKRQTFSVLSAALLGPRGGWRKSLSEEKPSECGVIVKCVKCRANTNLRQKEIKKLKKKKENEASKKWATLPETKNGTFLPRRQAIKFNLSFTSS